MRLRAGKTQRLPHGISSYREQHDGGLHNRAMEPSLVTDSVGATVAGNSSVKNTSGRRMLFETSNWPSFCKNIDVSLKILNHETPNEDVQLPERISEICTRVEQAVNTLKEYQPICSQETVWEDVDCYKKSLEEGLCSIKSATLELRHYIPSVAPAGFHSRNSSLASIESAICEFEVSASTLKGVIQAGYKMVQTKFNGYIKLIRDGLEGEIPALDGGSAVALKKANEAINVLDVLVEFETQSHGVDNSQFSLTLYQEELKERQQYMIDMFSEICTHTKLLHETLFVSDHLLAKGTPSIKKLQSLAAIMKKCWKRVYETLKRMTQICPMYTEFAQECHGRLLWHGTSLLANAQDCSDLRDYLENAKPISYSEEVVGDMAKSQIWLISCADSIQKLTSRLTRDVSKQRKEKNASTSKTQTLINDLNNVNYDMVMTCIGRSCWLSSYQDRGDGPLKLLMDLKTAGVKTLTLVLNHYKTDSSTNSKEQTTYEDGSKASAMKLETASLQNSLFQLHKGIQRQPYAPAEEEVDDVEDVDDVEHWACLQFHEVGGARRLKTHISIKPFPLKLEGSLEFDQSPTSSEAKKSPVELMKSPWEASSMSLTDEDDDGSSIKSPVAPTNPLQESGSAASLELQTGFMSLESNEDMDSASHLGERRSANVSQLLAYFPPPTQDKGTKNPFAEHMPSELPQEAIRSYGSAPLGDKEFSDIASGVSSGLVKDVLAVDLTFKETIGKGSEGHVLKMEYHTTPVAVKIMNNVSRRSKQKFKNETKLLQQLGSHPNIVDFFGRCSGLTAGESGSKADLVMVLEFCDMGNLFQIIGEAKYIKELEKIKRNLNPYRGSEGYTLYFDWGRRLSIAKDIAAGAAHIHASGIIHRDLTSFNVVLKKENDGLVAKICDFERSKLASNNQYVPRSETLANSPAWSAPEVIRDEPYSNKADVFSFGVILWELWTLEEPWRNPDEPDQDFRQNWKLIPHIGGGARLRIPNPENSMQEDLKRLIQSCWLEDSSKRPTMIEVHQQLTKMKEMMNI